LTTNLVLFFIKAELSREKIVRNYIENMSLVERLIKSNITNVLGGIYKLKVKNLTFLIRDTTKH
jgi:hypothetical protein